MKDIPFINLHQCQKGQRSNEGSDVYQTWSVYMTDALRIEFNGK